MSRNKVVVHISTVHSWQDPRIFQKQCRSLVKAGYEVHLITPDGVNLRVDGVLVHKLEVECKGKIERYTKAAISIFRQAFTLEPDIIHFHDPELIPHALMYRRPDVNIIYDIHEDNLTAIEHREYLNPFMKYVMKKLVSFFEGLAYKKLTTIIAEKYYSERFPEAVRVLNYPILDWQNADKSGDDKIEDALLYTGNVRVERGALIYADIVRSLNAIKLWCIGRCDSGLAKQMTERSGTNADNLIIEGVDEYVSFDLIVDAYTSKKWLGGLAIFPDNKHFRKKHLTKFFEYMAAGIPIIYSDFPEWKNLLDPLKVGFSVNPENFNEIISSIEKLKDDKKLWEQFSQNGRNAVKNSFSWETQERNLLKIYSGNTTV